MALITPGGLNVRLRRDSLGMPHLHGAFTGPSAFVVCHPEGPSSVPLLLGTERLGFTNRDVLSRSPTFLTGVSRFVVPASYEPLDRSMHLSAVWRRMIMKLRAQDSFELASSRNAGESRHMDWTRNFDDSPGRNKYGLVFVDSKT